MDPTEVISNTNIVDCPTQVTCFVHSDVYICHNTNVGNRKKTQMGNLLTQVLPGRGRRVYKERMDDRIMMVIIWSKITFRGPKR